jgi:hypothetical protein
MSTARTLEISSSSAAAGSAPGCSNRRMPSRNTISVGMERISNAPDSSCSASVSIFPKVMSACLPDTCS